MIFPLQSSTLISVIALGSLPLISAIASTHLDATARHNPCGDQPTAIYYGSNTTTRASTNIPIKLKIANGGAGQSGLLEALANAFIDDQVRNHDQDPFTVAWIKSDTTASFNHLADSTADVSITYNVAAEDIAIAQGIADKRTYAFRDHFLLVGPKGNPANLTIAANTTVDSLFSQLFIAMVNPDSSIRFLSRFDKSATNIKESAIWTSIGQTPWSYPFSFFYHIDPQYPYQALATAAKLEEYMLIDRGSYYGVDRRVREALTIFIEGKDDDPNDVLLNPAHALVGAYAKNKVMANAFADWVSRSDGGQMVVREFAVNRVLPYTPIPGA